MVKVRTAKSKGSQLEYDTEYSLKPIMSDIYRTSERGFQKQYDLRSDMHNVCIECKRLKGISWNELVKFHEKLDNVAEEDSKRFIVFKSNRQPALVFLHDGVIGYHILTFEQFFEVPFQKHPSTRVKKNGAV
jgi:hypothetical protein